MLKGLTFAAALMLAMPVIHSANAVPAELARKCQVLTSKAYPPRQPGNPAAGRKNGDAAQVRAYYNKCMETDGKMDEQPK